MPPRPKQEAHPNEPKTEAPVLHIIKLEEIKDLRLMDTHGDYYIFEPHWTAGEYYIRPCPEVLKP